MLFKFPLYGAVSLLACQALAMSPHEKLAQIPSGWKAAGAPAATTRMTLQVALVQQNLDKMEQQLYAVSTPGDPSYGKHWTREQVQALVAPSKEAESSVLAWLKGAGITSVSSDGDVVTFVADVAAANKLLDTTFLYYEQAGVKKIRTLHYSIPQSVAGYVDFVTPTTMFGKIQAQARLVLPTTATENEPVEARAVAPAPPCSTSITPSCLKQLYNVNYVPTADGGSYVGFGSFLNQSYRHKDLSLYESFNNIPQQQAKDVFVTPGAPNQQTPNANVGEANLDVQNIIGVSHPIPVTQFLTGGVAPYIPDPTEPTQDENEPYLPYYQFLLSKPNKDIPQVISNSYGEDEQTVPEKYAKRVCNMIGQLGLRGVTIFESSGDEGIGAACISTDGTNAPQFNPIFPATCPYLTSVGGTQSISPEIAWVGSSGGFSYYWPAPNYQYFTVQNYLKTKISKSTLQYYQPYFNQSGRGFPDVSAHSVAPDYQVYYNNELARSGGTSAASPVLAAITAMLNDALLKNGKPVLGFLNPFLYHKGKAGFTDITSGGSIGCNGNNTQTGEPVPGSKIIPYASWNATIGWDPVTGLGVPNMGKLLKIVLS